MGHLSVAITILDITHLPQRFGHRLESPKRCSLKHRTMDNVQNRDSYVTIPSSKPTDNYLLEYLLYSAHIIISSFPIKSNTVQDVEKSIQNKQYKALSQYSYNSKIEVSKYIKRSNII
jgi:hypothetical protein